MAEVSEHVVVPPPAGRGYEAFMADVGQPCQRPSSMRWRCEAVDLRF